jgi:hypothetical protein
MAYLVSYPTLLTIAPLQDMLDLSNIVEPTVSIRLAWAQSNFPTSYISLCRLKELLR